MAELLIEATTSGLCDLKVDGRRVGVDLDLAEAMLMAKRKGGGQRGDTITVVEIDGYRVRHRLP